MEDELHSLDKNGIWSFVKLPANKKTLQINWLYKVKDEIDGSKWFGYIGGKGL